MRRAATRIEYCAPDPACNLNLAAEGSDLLREALGDHVYDSLLANKKLEWGQYRSGQRRAPKNGLTICGDGP